MRPFDRPTSAARPFARHGSNSSRPTDRTTNQPFGIRSEILKVASAAFPLPRLTIHPPSVFAASSTLLPRLRKSPIGPHRRVKRRSTSGGRVFSLPPPARRRDDPEERLPKEFKLVPARVYRTKIN